MKTNVNEMAKPELFREKLQNQFDLAFSSGDYTSLREHYIKLRNIEFHLPFEYTKELINISALIENLTIACDIIVGSMGVNFIFCGNETSHIYGNGKVLSKAFLNVLSNAYLHGKGNLVTIKTIESDEYVKIEVKNEGLFSALKFGDGLSFIHKTCRNMNGMFFIETDGFSTNSVMCIKKSVAVRYHNYSVPYFYEYLNDKLSPVYIELFGMIKNKAEE